MLPFKFKQRKCEEIIFRNASTQNMCFYLRVHTNPSQLPFGDLQGSQDYFDSPPTESPTINPVFIIEDTGEEGFAHTFNRMTTSNVIIELRSQQDEAYSVPFKVNFCRMNYIGENLSSIGVFDFPLIAFRFTPNLHQRQCRKEFFTSED